MFKFNHFDGEQHELKVKFHHIGKKKGKAPSATVCEIRHNTTNELISDGLSRPVREIPVVAYTEERLNEVVNKHGRRIKKILKAENGTKIVILKADRFSRSEGRKEALKKALDFLPPKHVERREVWDNYFAKFSKDR